MPVTPFKILVADLGDIDVLARIEIDSKTASFAQPIDPIEIDRGRRRERWRTYFMGESPTTSKPERVVLKAMIDADVVGYLAGHLTTRFGMDAEIQSFYVLRSYQRRGIGRALLRRLIEWLAMNDVQSLCVGIAQTNPYQAFYGKYGAVYRNAHWMMWSDLDELRCRLDVPNASDG
jgi:GNAT superfamily N-acetyltransferase